MTWTLVELTKRISIIRSIAKEKAPVVVRKITTSEVITYEIVDMYSDGKEIVIKVH